MKLNEIISQNALIYNHLREYDLKISKVAIKRQELDAELEEIKKKIAAELKKIDKKIEKIELEKNIYVEELNNNERILLNGVLFSPIKIADIIALILFETTKETWQKEIVNNGKENYLYLVKQGDNDNKVLISVTPISDEANLNFRNMTFSFIGDDLKLPVYLSTNSKKGDYILRYINKETFASCWPIRKCLDEIARAQIERDGDELDYYEMHKLVEDLIKHNYYIREYTRIHSKH